MILSFLICDSTGHPFYSRNVDASFQPIDDALLGGLLSAIGTMGKSLFKQDIATISFGLENSADKSYIVTVTKDLFFEDKSIYFVYFIKGECNYSLTREIATNVFIECKQNFKYPFQAQQNTKERVDRLIDMKFHGLK